MNKPPNDRTHEIDKNDARDDLIACVMPGKHMSMGVFVATFGAVYLSQKTYMYKTKKFMKSKNQWWLPFGIAFGASYGFFINLFLNCRKEVMKSYPQFIMVEQSSTTTTPQSTEFDDDDKISST